MGLYSLTAIMYSLLLPYLWKKYLIQPVLDTQEVIAALRDAGYPPRLV